MVSFDLFTGRCRRGEAEIIDLRGRIITSASLRPIGWGFEATHAERCAVAETLLFYAGVRDCGALANLAAWDLVLFFPSRGWSITTDQLCEWVHYVRSGDRDGQTCR